jgi:hypothetical protein
MVRGAPCWPQSSWDGAVLPLRGGSPRDVPGAGVAGPTRLAAVAHVGQPASGRPRQTAAAVRKRLPHQPRRCVRPSPRRGSRRQRPWPPCEPKAIARPNGLRLPPGPRGCTGGVCGCAQWCKPTHTSRWRRPPPCGPPWKKRPCSRARRRGPTLAPRWYSPGGHGRWGPGRPDPRSAPRLGACPGPA